MADEKEPLVALYWDFENIHASLYDRANGDGAYGKRLRTRQLESQSTLVDVGKVMELAASFGTIAINKAYANWQWFGRYRHLLLHNAVDLIQLFPPGSNAKNGADIRLSLDLTEDILRFPHIDIAIVVAGDSDYMAVSHKIKASGKRLIGLGSKGSVSSHWAQSCHEFKYYEDLDPETVTQVAITPVANSPAQQQLAVITPAVIPEAVASLGVGDEIADLLSRAIGIQSRKSEDGWANKASIRPMATRLDSTFNLESTGCTTFSDLLDRYNHLFEKRTGQHDQEYRIRPSPSAASTSVPDVLLSPLSPLTSAAPVALVATEEQLQGGTVVGTIKSILHSRSIGFITRSEGGRDLFFHKSALLSHDYNDLEEGDEVEVDWVPRPREKADGAEAVRFLRQREDVQASVRAQRGMV